MTKLENATFVCIDCESTGLDPKKDEIIEIAIIEFQLSQHLNQFESLVCPPCEIPQDSIEIHHITQDMVQGKPPIKDVLPHVLKIAAQHIIVGHNIQFDIDLICEGAKKSAIPCKLYENQTIDTLRLARLYGGATTNSLESLRQHFNIPPEDAHRAMSDVLVNIEVFKRLITKFKTVHQIIEKLKYPIQLKAMPLGKHKGRPFKDIPVEYLSWAARQNFDQDLLYSIKTELKNRKKRDRFEQAGNPFSSL
ncbi:MAG: DUF3820 family protein [Simkaniaceae bacterium]|nr:DUF3820 family protein [Simkaniaceae bacterium]MCF7852293.1 DUF3820 family protein [Simkaniaceae bacterium]